MIKKTHLHQSGLQLQDSSRTNENDDKNNEFPQIINNYIKESHKMILKKEYRKFLSIIYKFIDKNKSKFDIKTQEAFKLYSKETISCLNILVNYSKLVDINTKRHTNSLLKKTTHSLTSEYYCLLKLMSVKLYKIHNIKDEKKRKDELRVFLNEKDFYHQLTVEQILNMCNQMHTISSEQLQKQKQIKNSKFSVLLEQFITKLLKSLLLLTSNKKKNNESNAANKINHYIFRLFENIQDKKHKLNNFYNTTSLACMHIAKICYQNFNFNQAIQYYFKAIQINQSGLNFTIYYLNSFKQKQRNHLIIKYASNIIVSFVSLSQIYTYTEQFSTASLCLQTAQWFSQYFLNQKQEELQHYIQDQVDNFNAKYSNFSRDQLDFQKWCTFLGCNNKEKKESQGTENSSILHSYCEHVYNKFQYHHLHKYSYIKHKTQDIQAIKTDKTQEVTPESSQINKLNTNSLLTQPKSIDLDASSNFIPKQKVIQSIQQHKQNQASFKFSNNKSVLVQQNSQNSEQEQTYKFKFQRGNYSDCNKFKSQIEEFQTMDSSALLDEKNKLKMETSMNVILQKRLLKDQHIKSYQNQTLDFNIHNTHLKVDQEEQTFGCKFIDFKRKFQVLQSSKKPQKHREANNEFKIRSKTINFSNLSNDIVTSEIKLQFQKIKQNEMQNSKLMNEKFTTQASESKPNDTQTIPPLNLIELSSYIPPPSLLQPGKDQKPYSPERGQERILQWQVLRSNQQQIKHLMSEYENGIHTEQQPEYCRPLNFNDLSESTFKKHTKNMSEDTHDYD